MHQIINSFIRKSYNFMLFVATKNHNDFLHDVFLIYGPTAESWVFEVLLKRLEGEWNYDCFVPERDLLGGEGQFRYICHIIAFHIFHFILA